MFMHETAERAARAIPEVVIFYYVAMSKKTFNCFLNNSDKNRESFGIALISNPHCTFHHANYVLINQ